MCLLAWRGVLDRLSRESQCETGDCLSSYADAPQILARSGNYEAPMSMAAWLLLDHVSCLVGRPTTKLLEYTETVPSGSQQRGWEGWQRRRGRGVSHANEACAENGRD